MNLDLIDPFVLAQECPDTVVGSLHSGHATALRFNRKGDFLASGRYDGSIVIFDMETSGVARKLRGHTKQVQSLSWSSCGRYLLSASQDWRCVLWDLANGSRVRTIRFTAPVFIAEMHPLNPFTFVVALFEDQPIIVDATHEAITKRCLQSVPRRMPTEQGGMSAKALAQDAKHTTTVTIFSHDGAYVLAGTNKGWLNIIDAKTCETVFSHHVANGILTLLRLGTVQSESLLINSSDRVIRTVRMSGLNGGGVNFDNYRLDNENKYQDIVNSVMWNHATFSATGEYVAASIHMNHNLYVWETSHHSLEKILEGPKEELSVVEWHPHRPFLAAVGVDSGRIHLWSVIAPQRWSALAPDFAEVEENVEYVEREDEFDLLPTEELNKRILRQEDEDIDVLTVEASKRAVDYQNHDFKMPVIIGVEDSESDDEVEAVGAGQFRRKSPGRGKDWAVS